MALTNKTETEKKKILTTPTNTIVFETPQVLVCKSIVETILVALKEYKKEVMGILMGKDYPDQIDITDVIILEQTGSAGGVSITDDAIAQFMSDNVHLFEDGKRIIGWWHTHPNMSSFQSGTDTNNNMNLIQTFVDSKKPCYMFSIITGSKFTRSGNFYNQWNRYGYERQSFSVEDVDFSIYVFFTLGGFYANEKLPEYFVEKDSPYSVKEIPKERYDEIMKNFKDNLISLSETKKPDKPHKKGKHTTLDKNLKIQSAKEAVFERVHSDPYSMLTDEDLQPDPSDYTTPEDEAELERYRCDIFDRCPQFQGLEDEDGNMIIGHCFQAVSCGVIMEDVSNRRY